MALPTNITADTTGAIAGFNATNAEVNRLAQDTGRRNVGGLLINGWSATAIEIQRKNERCYLRITGLNGSAATSSRFLDMPAGFQPYLITETYPQRDSSGAFKQGVTLSLSGGFTMPTGTVHGTGSTREVSWDCTAGWPATLPGTAL
ncbi:hypothetical protein [Glutamicibacter halophytocola]|uniref:hypothetical protein n=1 Tax=Glutamicibacter halophytocola TaxID=1933880 RepID=UPI0015C52B45|nr:hypothetical protein [Glutamicibacter halophytocola]NQD40910.1 hypothetical protein [Glutamicibacter halophytocola]